nr:glycosyltransferase [Lactiplantibacillus plantarum]
MQYGAIVVTFNRKQLLIESITALLNQTVPPAKIIIIDNHSTDGTKAELQTADILANPSVDYRYLTKNIGGAGGFARGCRLWRRIRTWIGFQCPMMMQFLNQTILKN